MKTGLGVLHKPMLGKHEFHENHSTSLTLF